MSKRNVKSNLDAEHDKYWKYPERSCLDCKKYPCFIGIQNSKADFAKYGCIKYLKICK